MNGTWELVPALYEAGWLLKFKMSNGHTLVFPLPTDHPIAQGMQSASRMKREEPA